MLILCHNNAMSDNNSKDLTIIFTDLDGTLLNHDDYSFDDALEMLTFIKSKKIPLVIVTSKTKAEVIRLHQKLALDTPFIVENGAGIIFPQGESYKTLALGFEYDMILHYFNIYAKKIQMHGFYEMSVEKIMQLTDLDYDSASHAKQRNFSEPFLLEDETELDNLRKMANRDGLDVIKGGRFFHLITQGQDKAVAIKEVIKYYESISHTKYRSIALGDSPNDLTMLQSVNIPILIPHLDGSYLECEIENLIKAPSAGASGWNSALKDYFHAK